MVILRFMNALMWLIITPLMWPVLTLISNRYEFYQQMKTAWCYLLNCKDCEYQVMIKCRRNSKERRKQ